MLRGDNHFIRIEDRWVLIDGPWKERLDNLSYVNYIAPIRLVVMKPMRVSVVDINSMPKYVELEYIEWYRVMWYPGGVNLHQDHYKYFDWRRVLSQRGQIGYALESGVVPVTIDRIEMDEELDYEVLW